VRRGGVREEKRYWDEAFNDGEDERLREADDEAFRDVEGDSMMRMTRQCEMLKATFDEDDQDVAGWKMALTTIGIQTVLRVIDLTRFIFLLQALHSHSYAYNRERLAHFQKMVN